MGIIKKFNELFDDEASKSEFEIDYLKGNIPKDILSGKWGKNVWTKGKSTPESLLEKLIASGLHQLLIFVLDSDLGIETKTFNIKESEIIGLSKKERQENDPDSIFYMFGLIKGKVEVYMGIKIRKNEKYDLFMVCEGTRRGDFSDLQRDISFSKLCSELKYNWTEFLSFLEVRGLEDFGRDELNLFYN